MTVQDNPWLVANADERGKWVVVRIAKEMPAGVVMEDYPEYACIHWEVQSNTPDLMPAADEMDQMDSFEERISEHDGKLGWLMYCITGNMRKDWVWYVRDGNAFLNAVKSAASCFEAYPIQVGLAKANGWTHYRDLLESISG